MKALKLVKQGKTATLGKLYSHDIPAFGARSWTMEIPGTPTGGPFGKNALVYHDEFVQTEIGQIGTQFDGPGHIGVRTSKGDFYYNGRWREESYERGPGGRVLGMGVLGVEHVAEKAFVCRGVLLDGPAYRGVKRLPIPKDTKSPGIVTAADVKAMVYRQGLAEIGEGDCVFLYTATETSGSTRSGRPCQPRRRPSAARSSTRASRGSASALAGTSPSGRSP